MTSGFAGKSIRHNKIGNKFYVIHTHSKVCKRLVYNFFKFHEINSVIQLLYKFFINSKFLFQLLEHHHRHLHRPYHRHQES